MTMDRTLLLHHTPVDGRTYWIRVRVHDTLADYRRTVARHHKLPVAEVNETAGSFTHAAQPGRGGYLGIVRFSSEFLNPLVIAHEAVHVAVLLAHVHYGTDTLRLGRKGRAAREEFIATTVGELVDALSRKLLDGREPTYLPPPQ